MKRFLMLLFLTALFIPSISQVTWAENEMIQEIPSLPRYKIHIVKAGDNLHRLAAHYYNNARLWRFIYEANRKVIKNPNLIHPGQKLLIPDIEDN